MASPLEEAIEQRRLSKVRKMIEADRSLLVQPIGEDCRPLHLCIIIQSKSIFSYIAENLSPRQLRSKKEAYLHYAAHYGFSYGVKKLVELGISPKAVDDGGFSAVFYATWGHQPKMIGLLAQLGSNVSKPDGSAANTPLHSACAQGDLACAKALVHAGADLEYVTKGAGTPLTLAAANGQMEIVQYLLDLGVNPRKKDTDGRTATYYATRYGHRDISAVLKAATRRRSS